MVRYELFNGSKQITKCCSTPQLMDDLYKIDETELLNLDEMLNAENLNLRDRVCELERKVQTQEDELVCLRSSVADFLRRLTTLEQGTSLRAIPVTTEKPPLYKTDVFKRLSARSHLSTGRLRSNANSNSQSTLNLHSNSSFLKNNVSEDLPVFAQNHEGTQPKNSSYQETIDRGGRTFSKPFTRKSDDNHRVVNVSRSSKTSPMRKWMSSADMKIGNGNGSHLLRGINAENIPAPNGGLKSTRSINKLGSLTSLAASHRSLNHLSTCHRDPVYLHEQRMLQVVVRRKTALLPVPSSVGRVCPTSEIEPPLNSSPRLEWVHGYRGKDLRNNLQVLPTGEIVYFIGAVVVLFDPEQMSQRHYTKHTSEIKCIAVHPNRLHIATGQTSRHSPEKKILNEHRSPICSPAALDSILEADQTQAHVRIWDPVTLQTLKIIGVSEACFERSVACVAFSRVDGGALLAVIDDSYEHTLSVWEWQRQKKLAEAKSANDQVFACEFHPYLNNSLVLYGKGHFNFWTFENGHLAKKSVIFEGRDKPKLVLSVCFGLPYVFSGDSNGSITVWDFKTAKAVLRAEKVHNGGVWSLCSLADGHVISGGKDRCLIEWSEELTKLRGPTPINDGAGTIRTIVSFKNSTLVIGTTKNEILKGDMKQGFRFIMQGHADELWALSTSSTLPRYLTGSIDGTLRLWDSVSKFMIWSMVIQEGITCLDFHSSGRIFAVGTVLGVWIAFDADTREQIYFCNDASQPVSSLRFSPDGKLIAVAFKDSHAYIYGVAEDFKRFFKVAQLAELFSFITIMDWSTDSTLLRSNNNDFEQQIWNATNGKLADACTARNATWASSRCIVSFENGCIAQTIPGIMAIERSLDSSCVAVAIDNGAIRLYRYPTTSIMAMYREIFGHSAFIGNVGFLKSHLISIGAKDSAIFQWKL